ncbi:hypothetical protein NMY22_g11578 [Coprinellus aureogranulatus]|nr:hypothetical protein NMY22_g11578 [Coprinellus aureogranulatus]
MSSAEYSYTPYYYPLTTPCKLGNAMSSACAIPADPDISGIGVRISIYIQTLLLFIPAGKAISDGEVSDTELELVEYIARANLSLGLAMVFSGFIQESINAETASEKRIQISPYHMYILLSMCWIVTSHGFVYLLLHLQHTLAPHGPFLFRLQQGYRNSSNGQWKGVVAVSKTRLFLERVFRVGHGPDGETRREAFRRNLLFWSLQLTLISMLYLGIPGENPPDEAGSSCPLRLARLTILWWSVPFVSEDLRKAAYIYWALAIPIFNLILPALPIFTLFWLCSVGIPTTTVDSEALTPPAPPKRKAAIQRMSLMLKRSLPSCIGLLSILTFNVVLIVNIELTLKRNRNLQDSAEETQWGFGQTLAVILVLKQVWNVSRGLLVDSKVRKHRRREELHTQFRDDALRAAIADSDVENVHRWLSAGQTPTPMSLQGTVGCEVCRNEKPEIAPPLRQREADPRVEGNTSPAAPSVYVELTYHPPSKPFHGSTLMDITYRSGDSDSILPLLEDRVEPKEKALHCHPILHFALTNEKVTIDIVRLLLEHGANPNAGALQFKPSALHVALGNNSEASVDVVQLLLEHGANPNLRDHGGNAALHIACSRGGGVKDDVIRLLLERGAYPGFFNDQWTTELQLACSNHDIDANVIRVLLEHGVDPNFGKAKSLVLRFNVKLLKLFPPHNHPIEEPICWCTKRIRKAWNGRHEYSRSPLQLAKRIHGMDSGVVRVLIQYGASIPEDV